MATLPEKITAILRQKLVNKIASEKTGLIRSDPASFKTLASTGITDSTPENTTTPPPAE